MLVLVVVLVLVLVFMPMLMLDELLMWVTSSVAIIIIIITIVRTTLVVCRIGCNSLKLEIMRRRRSWMLMWFVGEWKNGKKDGFGKEERSSHKYEG